MPDGFSTDFSELDTLAADLGDAAHDAVSNVVTAVKITSLNVKKAWAEKLTGENGLPHAPRSITFDLDANPVAGKTVISSEIGAERGRLQAPIVTVIEFGSPVNSTPPRGYGAGALQENEADFIHGLELAIDPKL